MSIPQSDKKYTYADYLTWPENERWEIIDGVPYMQAAPTWQHQSISGEIYRQISNYLVDKPCRVFAAPFDLCIVENNETDEEISNIISQSILFLISQLFCSRFLRIFEHYEAWAAAHACSQRGLINLQDILGINRPEFTQGAFAGGSCSH